MKNFSLRYPVTAAFLVFGLCVLLRILDVFLWRSDELFGEQIFAKVAGAVFITIYVWLVKHSFSSIGLDQKHFLFGFKIGLMVMGFSLFFGYFLEWAMAASRSIEIKFRLLPLAQSLIAEKVEGGTAALGAILLIGNFINSTMEEALFRGVLLGHLFARLSFSRANFVQALLFSLWHIVWPLREYLEGHMTLLQAGEVSVGYLLAAGGIGYAFGLLYSKSGTLWAPIFAHTLNNTAYNFLHVTNAGVLNKGLFIRIGLAVTVFFLITVFMKTRKQMLHRNGIFRWNLPE